MKEGENMNLCVVSVFSTFHENHLKWLKLQFLSPVCNKSHHKLFGDVFPQGMVTSEGLWVE